MLRLCSIKTDNRQTVVLEEIDTEKVHTEAARENDSEGRQTGGELVCLFNYIGLYLWPGGGGVQ